MTRALAGLAALVLLTGCGSTDPTLDSMSGRWRSTVNGLGIGFVTLDLTEDNHTVTGTGGWTPQVGSGTSPLTAQGIRFDANIQISLVFASPTTPQTLVMAGRVLGSNSFYLLFPTDPNATRITFERR